MGIGGNSCVRAKQPDAVIHFLWQLPNLADSCIVNSGHIVLIYLRVGAQSSCLLIV